MRLTPAITGGGGTSGGQTRQRDGGEGAGPGPRDVHAQAWGAAQPPSCKESCSYLRKPSSEDHVNHLLLSFIPDAKKKKEREKKKERQTSIAKFKLFLHIPIF